MSRAIEALFAVLALAILITAASIEPRPAGFGTHEELGLEPCGYLRTEGRPCITCGMTTAFAAAVRLDFAAAFRASPAGLAYALSTAAGLAWILDSWRRRLPAARVFLRLPPLTLLILLFVLALLSWWWKLATWPTG